MANAVTSYEIKAALSKKHGDREFFMAEVKNGPTGVAKGRMMQFDGVAIYKSWANPCIRGYEIKISRSDFLRDVKYACYYPYFHEFYFVVPKGLIKREELDPGIGLMYYDPVTGNLTTKKKAVYQKIDLDANMLMYIIMYRLESDRAPFMLHKEEAFRAWLNEKESNRELSYRVKSKLLEQNIALERRINELEHRYSYEDAYKELQEVFYKHGISGFETAKRLDKALSKAYPLGLDKVLRLAQDVVGQLEKITTAGEVSDEGDKRDIKTS